MAQPFERIELTPNESRDAEQIAALLTRDEPALTTSLDFGPFVTQGDGTGPRILIGDQSEIPLLTYPTPQVLDHRMAVLARDGDVVVLDRPDPDFFEYIHTVLYRPRVACIAAGANVRRPVAKTCRNSAKLRATLEELVERSGEATVMPYMTTGNAWRLAQTLGERTGHRVHVAGPAPRVARRVNDKLWFTALTSQVLGPSKVPPTLHAFGPAAAAGIVRQLARKNQQIVLKVPDSAGSAGNIRLDSDRLVTAPLHLIARFLRRRLAATGWQGRYPLLVGVWDSDVICSPSVQIWVPLRECGPPLVEGVFEQHLHGIEAEFAGGARSTLPAKIQMRLAHEAMRVAAVLQRIGYYGRCSFDAVLVRKGTCDVHPHWIECNGRWGGVSIPMTAATELNGGNPPKGLMIVQAVVGERKLSTADVLACLDPILFRPGKTGEGLVLVAPPQSGPPPQLTLVALAASQIRAEVLIKIAQKRLTI